MKWTKRLSQLNDVLAELVPFQESIYKFIQYAEIKPQAIRFQGSALDIWNSVISEAEKNSKINDLIDAVLDKYPDNVFLKTAKQEKDIDYTLSPEIDNSNWAGTDETTLEKLTLGMNSMLPISFLEKGIQKGKSVAKVEIENGSFPSVGTGFLFKIELSDELYFMTNHHVIRDKSKLSSTKILFGFEKDIYGNSTQSELFVPDENSIWITSPVNELDLTVFKLKDNENSIDKYEFIRLKHIDIEKNDFVNIIQHPAGGFKHISLYHNIVTNKTEKLIHYLTDTGKGSSGAPVFNSNWDIVALHHSGGKPKEKEKLPFGAMYRNEGILINNIIDFLKTQLPNI